ncbi:SDR family NAD(P)-dependent oxidoreductase [Cryptosporangium aurantiacum]|uniref:Short chain dehydrogenase n=1 Tax=Cryptosporangium aurantiacum TaxID=134849 RepID=A0A1M7JK59_9ACTN|nr:SDR family NAD(P)-dependent oxidoreductase [Cryptosporangium aurantiacum]SHM53499.1 short chain dehydrogenase [Cryptosporangium aurantiacum]
MKPVGRTAALVNGAGSTVGRAITGLLLAEGYRVCATDADAIALRTTLRTADRRRVAALVGEPDDVDHQDDAIERTLSAFGRIDVLVTVVDAATVRTLVERPETADHPTGWIRKVDLAWTGDHGGTAVTLFQPLLTRDGTWPASVAVRLSRYTARLQDEFGPSTRLISVLPPPALLGEAPVAATARPAPRRSAVMPLRSAATVPELVGYLLSRRGQGLAGRTVLANRAGVPWSVVDAPLPAPSTGSLARTPWFEPDLAPAVGWHVKGAQ